MAARIRKSDLGFGFDPSESAHHFVLILPNDGDADTVELVERYTYGECQEPRAPEPRARIDGYTWGRVAHTVQTHLNRRLKDAGRKTSKFVPRENLLAPHMGKELTLLFWVLDGIDPTDLPNALANWLGFVPEERWWLYATVKTSGAGPDEGRDRGWRRAIRIAFAENPAPPPADGTRGFAPEPLPIADDTEVHAEEPEVKQPEPAKTKQGSREQEPTLPMF